MAVAALVIVALLAGGLIALAPQVLAGRRPSGWLERQTTARLIIHTTDGQTIEGLVREVTADGIVLAAVRLVDAEVTLAGEVWVPRVKVLLAQRSTGST